MHEFDTVPSAPQVPRIQVPPAGWGGYLVRAETRRSFDGTETDLTLCRFEQDNPLTAVTTPTKPTDQRIHVQPAKPYNRADILISPYVTQRVATTSTPGGRLFVGRAVIGTDLETVAAFHGDRTAAALHLARLAGVRHDHPLIVRAFREVDADPPPMPEPTPEPEAESAPEG